VALLPTLETRALSIGYRQANGASRTVASDVTLALRPGELVCLMGPNGAGKSTLLRTLSGLQRPLDGRVLLEGQDLHAMSVTARGQRLSVVLTDRITAGMLTGYEVTSLGRHPHTDWTGALTAHDHEVVRRALDATGAGLLASRQVAELSDGERQRVMVARAVAQEPVVMLLDEITAFLDLPHRVAIMRLLANLAHERGVAILVSTHDLELSLRTADRLWLFGAAGRIHAGAPEDLVMDGAFEQAFAADGLAFDRDAGVFRTFEPTRGVVSLVGEGSVAAWTARALERAGYRVAACGEQAPLRVEVQSGGDTPRWLLTGNADDTSVTSLEALVAALRMRELTHPTR